MKFKDNKYVYKVENGIISGFFDIYQDRSGFIRLMMGNKTTKLTCNQINDLAIDLYELKDFNYEDYKKAYNL